MTLSTTIRWREPKSRLTLTLERFDEPLTIRVGEMTLNATRWARLRIEGKPNARWKALDGGLDHVSYLCESWCALDGGHDGTTFISDRYTRGMSPTAAFWSRAMSVRCGSQWLFDDFLETPVGATRTDALRLVTLLPATSLGDVDHCDLFEADYWESPEPDAGSRASHSVDLASIAPAATAACRAAVATCLTDGVLGELIAARIHTRTTEIDEYTRDTHDEAWLNVLAHVRVGHRDTRMVFTFPHHDLSSGHPPANTLAAAVLEQHAAGHTFGFLTLIAPTTSEAHALRRHPRGCDLNVPPPEVTITVWQTEWADRLFGDPS